MTKAPPHTTKEPTKTNGVWGPRPQPPEAKNPTPIILAALTALALSTPTTATPQDTPIRLPDGRILNLYCAGTGSPTFLLDAGWSADSRAWGGILPKLAAETRTCSIDRAGSGKSDLGPLPRDGAAIAKDLDHALTAGKIPGPYILIGHSAGGLYIRHFAARRPHDTAGLLFVDTTLAHQQRKLEAIYGPGAGSLAGIIRQSQTCLAAAKAGPIPADDPKLKPCQTKPPEAAIPFWTTRLSEIETLMGSTSSDLDTAPNFASKPVITLTATKNQPPQQAAIWSSLHREIASLSRCNSSRVLPDATHMIMHTRPDAIVTAALDILASVRKRRCTLE